MLSFTSRQPVPYTPNPTLTIKPPTGHNTNKHLDPPVWHPEDPVSATLQERALVRDGHGWSNGPPRHQPAHGGPRRQPARRERARHVERLDVAGASRLSTSHACRHIPLPLPLSTPEPSWPYSTLRSFDCPCAHPPSIRLCLIFEPFLHLTFAFIFTFTCLLCFGLLPFAQHTKTMLVAAEFDTGGTATAASGFGSGASGGSGGASQSIADKQGEANGMQRFRYLVCSYP